MNHELLILGVNGGARTLSLWSHSPVLCQLSYAHHIDCGYKTVDFGLGHSPIYNLQSPISWRAWPDLNGRHTAPEAVALSGLSYRRESLTC